jgi:hypothetical protein
LNGKFNKLKERKKERKKKRKKERKKERKKRKKERAIESVRGIVTEIFCEYCQWKKIHVMVCENRVFKQDFQFLST